MSILSSMFPTLNFANAPVTWVASGTLSKGPYCLSVESSLEGVLVRIDVVRVNMAFDLFSYMHSSSEV